MFRFFRKKPEDPPPPLATVIPAEATGDQRFAAALYPLLLAEPGNAIFSPYSIAAALTIVQAGASGPAREEIEAALGEPGAGDRLTEGSGELAPELAARSEPTPFEKRMVAAEKTRDKIREVLSAGMLSELTRVLLANAIYFKARWEQQFVEEQTRPSPFTLLNGKSAAKRRLCGYRDVSDPVVMDLAISVLMMPGSTIATRIPSALTSCARASLIASRANFEAA
jgi:serine protease inhibitor